MKITDFPEFLMLLGTPLGWDERLYRDNLSLQDDFLEELNIKTYNSFKDYLFYDVIQALSKVYIVNRDVKQLGKKESPHPSQEDVVTEMSDEEESIPGLTKQVVDE